MRWWCLILACFLFAEARQDFLLVKNPGDLSILNQFEQPLSKTEKGVFLPGSPFQILEADAVLGDQITHALKFQFERGVYFLLKDDKGGFIGNPSGQNCQIVKNCLVLNDTIRILKTGDLLIRVFRSGGKCYGKLPGQTPQFGFFPLPSSDAFEIVRVKNPPVSAVSTISPEEYRRITDRLAAANRTYQAFFSHFNRLTGKDKSIPVWVWENENGRVFCRLKGPAHYPEQLKESTQYVVRDLENIFIGKAMNVRYQNGEIVIEPRAKTADPQ